MNSYSELREQLVYEAEDEYREFTAKLILSERPLLGVRIPKVRELAGRVARERIEEFLEIRPVAIEEVLLRGFLICRLPYEEAVAPREEFDGKSWFDTQVDYIDNWCTCDTFCSGLKSVKKHRTGFYDERIDRLLEDEREFAVRVGLVLLKCYYVDFEWLAVVFDQVEKLAGREEYYIKMAIAWLVAECFIKYPDETMAYLKVSKLLRWTYNKTISKICDSHRVDSETKTVLKKMRKAS